jgi:magnesium-transporting ATPase (P-type)
MHGIRVETNAGMQGHGNSGALSYTSPAWLRWWVALLQVFEIPFNSANKWSLAVTSCPGDKSHQLVMMKGAPEIILTKCSHHLHNKHEKEIDDEFRANMQAAYERCGFMGERVIGFAYKRVSFSWLAINSCTRSFKGSCLQGMWHCTTAKGIMRWPPRSRSVTGCVCHVQVPARTVDSYHEDNNGPPTEGLVFMGLVSLVDPPRDGVLEAVNK